MSKTAAYRQLADGCTAWAASRSLTISASNFSNSPKSGLSDAESIDQGIYLRRTKASEMAGEEIDRLGDPLASDEERHLRAKPYQATPRVPRYPQQSCED
jgi:hypothetical protein